MDNDKQSAIRQARQQLRARGEPDSMNRVVAIVRSSKRTVQKYWGATDPVDAEPSAPPPVPAPVPAAPEPEPKPEFSLANLRAYYLNRFKSPWPAGMVPPLEAYPVLNTLWQEWDDELVKAERAHMDARNALGQQPSGRRDDGPVRLAENRRNTAMLMCHSIEHDRDILRQRARYEGKPIPA